MSRYFLNFLLACLFVGLGVTQVLAFRKASRESGIPALVCGESCATYASPPGLVLDLGARPHAVFAERGGKSPFSGDFDLQVEVKAGPPTGEFRVFLLRGEETNRLPLLALHPNQNRLHLRISSRGDWNDGTDSGLLLPEDQWVKVRWSYRRDGASLLVLENLDDASAVPQPEKSHIGGMGDFGTFTSVALVKAAGVRVRNFSLIHN